MKKPRVGIIMGSKSDEGIMSGAAGYLKEFGIGYDMTVASAHRTPKKVISWVKSADAKCDLVIAGAGMAAHLPGVLASYTTLPVIGVPISSKGLGGFDSLYSIVQMPTGIPVATVAIDGAKNAAILAAEILALKYPNIKKKLDAFRKKLAKK
jgi:5-(carboxyamino)imidazole ribonucleotide mutase